MPSSSSMLNLSQHQGLFQCQLFTSGDWNTGASTSASVLPMNIQGWFPLRFTDLILLFKGLSGVFFSTIVWRHKFFVALPSLWPNAHYNLWPLGRPFVVAQSCPILWYPMDCSTPGFPVLHHLLEFAQTDVHWISDAIQPSHPVLSPNPPASNLSSHQGIFKWVSSPHQVAKVLELQL